MFPLPIFTTHLALALIVSVGIATYQLGGRLPLRSLADVLLVALLAGFIGARIEGVLLNRDLFTDWRTLMQVPQGGLGWHGALFGAWIGLDVACRWRRIPRSEIVMALLPVLPLLALATWRACVGVGCGYGNEVESLAFHPTWQVWEAHDMFGVGAPRYATQRFGMFLSGCLLVFVALGLPFQSDSRSERGWWSMVAVFSLGMLLIGLWRAEYTRSMQLLDALTLFLSLGGMFVSRHVTRSDSELPG